MLRHSSMTSGRRHISPCLPREAVSHLSPSLRGIASEADPELRELHGLGVFWVARHSHGIARR